MWALINWLLGFYDWGDGDGNGVFHPMMGEGQFGGDG